MDYSEIVKDLRYCADNNTACSLRKYFGENCEQKVIERLFADGVYVMIDYVPTIIPADKEGDNADN